jgi:hypothetical protein
MSFPVAAIAGSTTVEAPSASAIVPAPTLDATSLVIAEPLPFTIREFTVRVLWLL